MQINPVSTGNLRDFGRRNTVTSQIGKTQDLKSKLSEEQTMLLNSSLDKIKLIKNELPRIAYEDSDIRRYKMMGDVEVLLNEISRNIHQTLGKTYYYYG